PKHVLDVPVAKQDQLRKTLHFGGRLECYVKFFAPLGPGAHLLLLAIGVVLVDAGTFELGTAADSAAGDVRIANADCQIGATFETELRLDSSFCGRVDLHFAERAREWIELPKEERIEQRAGKRHIEEHVLPLSDELVLVESS